MPTPTPRRLTGRLPTPALVLAGLAVVGFGGGAGTALVTSGDAATESTAEATDALLINQAGLTATRAASPIIDAHSSAASPATSTAPVSSVPSVTTPGTAGSSAADDRPGSSPVPRAGSPAAPAAPPLRRPTAAAPRPVAEPAPAPPPPAPAPAPPVIPIPDITLSRAPLVPQQPIEIHELRIG